MPATSLEGEAKETERNSRVLRSKSKHLRKKRKLSSSAEEMVKYKHKKPKKQILNSFFYNSFFQPKQLFFKSEPNDRVITKDKLIWNKIKSNTLRLRKRTIKDFCGHSFTVKEKLFEFPNQMHLKIKCWINDFPQEILLKIFSYLPLGILLHTIPQVCKKWEILALDWTLWKAVEDLTIKNMVISTNKLKTLLRTIPKLKKLELILRNDTEELLHELFETQQNLEVLKLDRCCRSTLQMNILSQTVISILEFCPKLKTVMFIDTYFHSTYFYRYLAKKFRTFERINITCTTKSEMNLFMENLKENFPAVEFQNVPMMGRAEGKQIYWGPILGLVVRPIPTSPFHQQYMNDNYPNYAF